MGAKTRKLSQINDSLIEWQSVVVADGSTGLTAVAGRGYFINTTAGAITVTLPSATAKPGDTIQLKDYARTWGTNNVTIASNTFDGATNANTFSTNGQTVTLVYMDNTRGWSLINEDTTSSLSAQFISATGGTILTSGDFKTHVFTGDDTFVVSAVGNAAGSNTVEYLVVAGGAGAGKGCGGANNKGGGGGGAGGLRQNYPSPTSAGLSVTATSFPITVGAGGSGSSSNSTRGTSGSNSIFSTITSTGGGGGGSQDGPVQKALNGGSGGGGGQADNPSPTPGDYSVSPGNPNISLTGGTGNTPPTSPPQGNNGGGSWNVGGTTGGGGGGGGAGAVGGDASDYIYGGNGGDGSPIDTTFFGPTSPSYGTPGPASGRYFSGGGGGAGESNGPNSTYGKGGAGGGAASPGSAGGASGTANTGGGGGGGGSSPGGTGGKGIVIIRYKFQ